MPIKLKDPSLTSMADIKNFERNLGKLLPENYKEFLLNYNGAKPESNTFKIGIDNDCGVDRFIPISKIIDEAKNIDHAYTSQIPIAWAEGGNYILLDLETGKISFWDHEIPEGQVELAPDINSFIDQIEPFDPNSVELKEGQVKSAWIDPEFLKNL